MYPKFIIVSRPGSLKGLLRMGIVCQHKDLAIDYEKVHGGGWWAKNDAAKEIILYGESGDYGHPDFRFLDMIPKEYEEYTFIYTPHEEMPGNALDLSHIEWV